MFLLQLWFVQWTIIKKKKNNCPEIWVPTEGLKKYYGVAKASLVWFGANN